jgi:hypothetical protein
MSTWVNKRTVFIDFSHTASWGDFQNKQAAKYLLVSICKLPSSIPGAGKKMVL